MFVVFTLVDPVCEEFVNCDGGVAVNDLKVGVRDCPGVNPSGPFVGGRPACIIAPIRVVSTVTKGTVRHLLEAESMRRAVFLQALSWRRLAIQGPTAFLRACVHSCRQCLGGDSWESSVGRAAVSGEEEKGWLTGCRVGGWSILLVVW